MRASLSPAALYQNAFLSLLRPGVWAGLPPALDLASPPPPISGCVGTALPPLRMHVDLPPTVANQPAVCTPCILLLVSSSFRCRAYAQRRGGEGIQTTMVRRGRASCV